MYEPKKWGRAAAAGTAFGLVFFGLLLRWILLFGAPAFVALVVLQTLWVVAGLHAGITINRNWRVPMLAVFPLALLAGEYLRGHLPLGGFTWGGVAYSQHDNLPLLRLAAFTGAWGVSLLVTVVNAIGAAVLSRIGPGRLLVGAAAVLALVFGIGILPVSEPGGTPARVAIVQGNLPGGDGAPEADDPTVLNNHVRLTSLLEPGEAELVIWPESTLDRDPTAEPEYLEAIQESIRRADAPLLVGGSVDVGEDRFRNVSFFFDAEGDLAGTYDKIHLVPFGEYVIGRRLLEPLISQLELVPRDGVPGDIPVVFSIPEGRFSSVICFESTFPGLVRRFVKGGARLLVVSTNNSSFEQSAASRQHIAFSQLRAAEHRQWLAHAALTGISAVVTPDGEVVRSTPLFRPVLLKPQVRFARQDQITFYARFGDWLPVGLLIAMLVGLVTWRRSSL